MGLVMDLKIKKLHGAAFMPRYATDGSGCFDIFTDVAGVVIPSNGGTVFTTGLAFEIPKDWVMLVFSRSGHGFNKGVRLSNCVGVIDSDYRGELKVKLNSDFDISKHSYGDAVAQGMLVRADQWNFVEVDELSETKRGTSGFGSTGS